MALSTVFSAIVGAVLALVGNAIGTYFTDRRKARYRWDEMAFNVFAAFAASARTARDGAARLSGALVKAQGDEARDELLAKFDELHAKMRGDFEQVALVGTKETILAGRDMIRGVYNLRRLAMDGVVAHDPDKWEPIHSELMEHQKKYYAEARAQLRIPAGPDPGSGVDPKAPKKLKESGMETAASAPAS